MNDKLIIEEDARGVLTLTLNRPDSANCYDEDIICALIEQIEHLDPSTKVRALVLRGAGRHFCGGADVGWHARHQKNPAVAAPGLAFEAAQRLRAVSPPTVALVHGACMGGGLALAAACDILIAADDALFALPEVRLGFPPGLRSAPFFARAMGLRNFQRYGMTGQRFTAADALRMGLAHEVCGTQDLVQTCSRQIDDILMAGPVAARKVKLMTLQLEPPTPSLEDIKHLFTNSLGSEEAVEGRRSFAEKRKPAWYPTP